MTAPEGPPAGPGDTPAEDPAQRATAAPGGGVAAGGAADGQTTPVVGAVGGGGAAPGGPAAAGGGAAGAPASARGVLRRLPVPVRAALAVGVVAVVVVLAIVLFSGGPGPIPGGRQPEASLADPVPYDGRSPLLVAQTEQRLLVEFQRPALGELPNARAMGADAQLRYIKSLKREQMALRSGLGANGVVFRDVVSYYRVWNGFAATIRTSDIPRLAYPGSQVRTVRRAFPAASEPVPVPAAHAPLEKAPLNSTPPIAVLDTGIDSNALAGHADPGYDAVDRDRDPRPGQTNGRKEASGTALAGILAGLKQRVLPIRIASFRAVGGAVEAQATTDELIAGLEHSVDPNGDGDTSDHVPVALVGVNAPYAGFSNSPEAQAVDGAAGLGTLVVAPAGNEGAAAPGSGTVGSPASAPESLAVGALSGDEPQPRVTLDLDGSRIATAAVLGGDPPKDGRTAGPVSETDPAKLQQTRLRDKVAIVRAGANPAAQAAAAAAVGARAVVIAQPTERSLPAMAAGRAAVPVIGVTGDPANDLLEAKPGTEISFGDSERAPSTDAPPRTAISPNTSQGPTAGGLPKPDLAAPGSALTVGPGGTAVVAGGSAIAAARVAAYAASLAQERPDLSPKQLRAMLMAHAEPANLPPERTGAGAAAPGRQDLVADPPAPVSGALDPISVDLNAVATSRLTLRATSGATVRPQTVTVVPGTPTTVSVRLPKPGTVFGRLEALTEGKLAASIPWLIRPDTVEPVTVGALEVSGGRRVRFTLGSFKRGPRTQIQVAARLILDLVDAKGNARRSLTVKGGARDLMPAEYAYAIPRASLPDGSYAFRVRAWAPRQEEPTVRRSALIRR